MKIQEKYTTTQRTEKDPQKEKDKLVLTDDAFALCEVIESLTEAINKLRSGLNG